MATATAQVTALSGVTGTDTYTDTYADTYTGSDGQPGYATATVTALAVPAAAAIATATVEAIAAPQGTATATATVTAYGAQPVHFHRVAGTWIPAKKYYRKGGLWVNVEEATP
jgi:hypothetical protein